MCIRDRFSSAQDAVKLNMFLPSKNLPWFGRREPMIDQRVKGMVEVSQTLEHRSLSPTDLKGIVFVFNANKVLASVVSCDGSRLTFFTRFRADNSSAEDLPLFPSFHPESPLCSCYSSTIWTAMKAMKDLFVKMLNRYSANQNNYCRKREALPFFPVEAWKLIVINLKACVEMRSYTSKSKNFFILGLSEQSILNLTVSNSFALKPKSN